MVQTNSTFVPTVYNYEGNNISFSKENGVMVNATQMAKPFGKSCNDWLRTDQAKRMIIEIATTKKCDVADLVRVINGGNSGNGTWMQEDVALVFAQWLSPKFYLWCNDRIKELLQNGVVTLPQNYIEALEALVESEKAKQQLALENARLDEEKQMLAIENARLDTENNILTKEYGELEQENNTANEKVSMALDYIKNVNPKARSWEKLANTDGLFTISQFASKIGLTAYKVNKFLVEKGVITNNKQRPTYKYIDKHFFECKELLITTQYGKKKTTRMFITTLGEEFVTNLLYQDGIINITCLK